MKHKMYVEEYIPLVNNYRELEDHPTFEPTERDEYIPPMPPPPTPTPMPTTFSYNPSSKPTYSMSYSVQPSRTSGIYSYAPFSYTYKSIPPIIMPPINITQLPSANPNDETYTPTCVLTYSPSKDIITNTTTIEYSYYTNDKYNTIVFGMATGLGTFCFCLIFAYVYKIYASKKYKLQKIQKNTLKREYVSLNDIHIADYNSQF
jgi:hypothetical protein